MTPELLLEIGRLTVAGSNLEFRVMVVLEVLVDNPAVAKVLAGGDSMDVLVQKARLLAAAKVKDEHRLCVVRDFLDEAAAVYKERNAIVHALWTHNVDTDSFERLRVKRGVSVMDAQRHPADPREIGDLANRIERLVGEPFYTAVRACMA